jgi:hypothetical protein
MKSPSWAEAKTLPSRSSITVCGGRVGGNFFSLLADGRNRAWELADNIGIEYEVLNGEIFDPTDPTASAETDV